MDLPGSADAVRVLDSAQSSVPQRSLRGSLVLFAVAICIAIIVLFSANMVYSRAVAMSVARRAAANLAESLAQQATDTLAGVDGALLAISQQFGDGTGPAVRESVRSAMTALVTTMPRLHDLLVVDEHGRVVVSSGVGAPVSGARFGVEADLKDHRDDPGSSVSISGPRRAQGADAYFISVSRRLNHRDGSFAGIAVAQIALDYFDRSYANVNVGNDGSIVLLTDDGTIVVRKPRALIGVRLRTVDTTIHLYGGARSGTYMRASRIDGVRRLYAFRRLDGYPLFVDVGLSEDEYLTDWRTAAWANVLGVSLVVTIIGSLTRKLNEQISRRKRAEESLARLALLDGLTELPNRRQFDAVLLREWRAAERAGQPLGLLMIDVDAFKAYNDRYGHLRGDDVLISVARQIAGSVRPNDLAARYGGEEFAVIMPATTVGGALGVAERIREAILELGITHADAAGAIVSVSIGVAGVAATQLGEPSGLVRSADGALYAAKRAGRNQTSVAKSGRPATAGSSVV